MGKKQGKQKRQGSSPGRAPQSGSRAPVPQGHPNLIAQSIQDWASHAADLLQQGSFQAVDLNMLGSVVVAQVAWAAACHQDWLVDQLLDSLGSMLATSPLAPASELQAWKQQHLSKVRAVPKSS